MATEKTLSLSVILMLAPSLENPKRTIRAEKCGFHIAGAGPRKIPMIRFWSALNECHRVDRRNRRLKGKRKTYITPEAMTLWRKWNGSDE